MILSPLADACQNPDCFPGDHEAVVPFLVAHHQGQLCAWYRHEPCGWEWTCSWDAESAGWPTSRRLPRDSQVSLSDPVTPARAAYNYFVLELSLDEINSYRRGVTRRRGGGDPPALRAGAG